MDKITEILKEMHEMQDEPVRMQTGGTVYTPEEYASSYVDFYAPFSIQVQKAPDPGDDDKDDDPIRPNILTPVGERDEGAPNIFSQVPIGDSKAAYNATYKDVNEYLEEFGKNETYKADTGGFEDYLKRGAESIKKQGLLPAGVVSLTGLPTGALAYGMGKLNREQQLKNANAIAQTGGTGGSMMTINGQTVSRRPGSRIFNGTLVGMSNDQAYRLDEIRRGFIPGTMKETASSRPDEQGMFNRSGKSGVAGGGKDDDYIIDAYGTVHSAGGAQTVGAFQAERARQDFLRSELDKRGLTFTGDFDAASRTFITSYRDQAKGGRGFFQTTARVDDATYAKDFANSSNIIDNILNGLSGVTGKAKAEEGDGAPPPTTPTTQPPDPAEEGGGPGINTGGDSDDSGYSENTYDPSYDSSQDTSFEGEYEDDDMYARGGRIGMQAGGVAQQPQPAGFVGGPPENFTDGQTVADDQPMSVPEGTFVINAAAVEFAGSDDIKKMLSKAYTKLQKKVDKTIGVAKIPTEDEIDVAVSRGEVIVPPEVAKIIGYDRLEKINNRGKKEVSRRQKKAGGGFLDGKKFADGGEIYEDRIIMEEVRRKMDNLLKNLPDDVKVDTRYYGDDYPANRDFHRQLAILNDADPDAFNMRAFSSEKMGLINVPQTPTLFNLYAMAEEIAHLEASKNRRPETETVRTLRADEQSIFASIPGTEGDMRTHYGAYEQGGFLYTPSEIASMSDKEKAEIEDIYGVPADKVRNTFSYPDYFELEQDYLEEMRAKRIAFETVFGKLDKTSSKNVKEKTKTGRAIDLAESSYGESFAEYILATASPTLQAAIYHKHPELRERYFDDQGRFKKRNIQPDADFRMAMRAENKEARERTLKEFEEADDRNIVVKNLTNPRKSTFIEGYGRVGLAEGGKTPKTLPKRKPRRGELADVELRADLEEYIRDDKLAKLGWDLYTSGDLKLIGTPLRKGTTGATAGGQYFPKKGEDDYPDYPSGTSKVETAGDAAPMWKALTSKLGRVMDPNAPTAIYFAEAMPAFDADRASVFITLAHELRHAALNHLSNEYGAPQQTLSTEERIMDFYDEKARREAAKKNPLVNKKFSPASLDVDKTSARQIPKYAKMHKMYEELAQAVLEERGVPTIAPPEEKGFIKKFLDDMFRKPHPATGKLKKGDGKPVDYESEAMQSANF